MIERDLRGVTSMLETLALMPALQQGDFATFHQQASRITARYGVGIVLRDKSGNQLLNTRVPWSTPLPSTTGTDAVRAVLETRMPYVTDVAIGAVSQRELVGVVVPVLRADDVSHLLTAGLPLERFRDILAQAGIGEGRTATVVDRKGRRLAVIPGGNSETAATWDWIGRAAAQEGIAESTQGPGDLRLVSGYSRSGMSGWATIVSLSGDEIDSMLARDLRSDILAGAAFLLLSGLLASVLGLRIARAARMLTAAGRALQSGTTVPPVSTSWREANEIGLALTTAFIRLSEKSAALRAVEELYATLARSSPVGIFRTDPEGRCTCVNERWCEIAGARPEQALGNGWTDFLHPDDYERVFAEWRRSALENRPFRLEYRFRTPSGATTWVLGEALIERNDGGAITGYVGTVTDITDNKALERQLRSAEQQLIRAMSAGRMFAFEWDVASDEVHRSDACGAILGLEENAENDTGKNYFNHVHPDDRKHFVDTLTRLTPDCPNYVVSYRYQRPDGVAAWLEESAAAIFDADGRMTGLTGVTADVTARKQVETALRESEESLRFALDAAEIGIWRMEAASGRMTWDAMQYRLFGIDPDPALQAPDGPSLNAFVMLVHPEDRTGLRERIETAARTGEAFQLDFRTAETDFRTAEPLGAEPRWLTLRCGVQRDVSGQPEHIIGVNWDITGRKAAEAILRDSNAVLEARVADRTRALTDAARELSAEIQRREQAQAALLQSQKLEAPGQLVSGVSHDFNNVLAVIQSSYSLLRRESGGMDKTRILDMAEQAVAKATGLIHHMMAFARREATHPRMVDLADVLRETEDMICHSAGSGVRCRFDVQDDLWPSVVDPSRLSAVLLNLAANARDAMPEGGELDVSARNHPSGESESREKGDRIVISVKDTGGGMTPEVIARASEPFFTTKPPGKGTGLGLASAHDFVRQAGGSIHIRSAVGAGTTIELHLPRAVVAAPGEEKPLDAETAEMGGDATILLVDDDENLRTLTAQMLRDFGYAVIEARSAETAIALAHITERLDLVITDILMPGASGPTLGTRLRLDRPALPVLYISGEGQEQAALAEGERMLRKPFGRPQLAEAVLERLGRLPKPTAPATASAAAPDKLRDRLRNPGLRDAYDRWCALRNAGGGLPDCDLFPSDDSTMKDNSFMVEAGGGQAGVYRYVRFGNALAERLGRSLVGHPVGDDGDELGSTGASYRRCQETALPSYEYARFSLADEMPLLFERLLLPLSDDGVRVTHLLGVVFFTELPKLDLQPRS
jgi:PAS domain S-box-containing protein